MSTSASTRSPASLARRAAWSVRSHVIVRAPAVSRSGRRPRLRTTTSWRSRTSARTTCRPTNSVPPITSTRILDRHREAGRRARHAVDPADLVGHEATDGVERRALNDGDEVERARDRVEVDDGGRAPLIWVSSFFTDLVLPAAVSMSTYARMRFPVFVM